VRAHDVGAERVLDGWVEGDVAGAVHDDVEVRGQVGQVAEVALHHLDQVGERLHAAGPLGRGGERRLAQQGGDPVTAGLSRLGPHQRHRAHAGQVGEQPLQQGFTDEAGHPGDEDAPAVQLVPQSHAASIVNLLAGASNHC